MEIDLRAYFLHPEIPPEGQVRRPRPFEPADQTPRWQAYADQEGLVMRRAELTPYTRPAQAITVYAKQQDLKAAGASGRVPSGDTPSGNGLSLADAFHHAAYRALWEDGANLGDMAVLEKLATGVGLNWTELAPKLEASEFDEELERQHDEAMRIGVEGVPAFVVDEKFYFSGAQPIELFRLAAKRALRAREDADPTDRPIGEDAV